MIKDNAPPASLPDAIADAGITGEGWNEVLAQMADACGFRSGELVGFGPRADLTFNFMSGFPAEGIQEFAAIGGGDPAVNPRVKAAAEVPVMQSIVEADFLSSGELRQNPFYADFCRRYDIPFGCMMPMIREGGSFVGLAMFRGQRAGHATEEERGLFESLAPHVRTAVRTQARLERQGARLIKGALEAMSIAAFVCDRDGRVQAMTESAERIVATGFLRIRQGQLRATNPVQSQQLVDAVCSVAMKHSVRGSRGPSAVLVLHDRAQRPVVVDVLPLPRREGALGFEPRALVLVKECRRDSSRAIGLLQAAWQLTPAEAQIGVQLADGHAPETIARMRGVATSTVRVQIRALYVKLGVRRQSELVARLSHLI